MSAAAKTQLFSETLVATNDAESSRPLNPESMELLELFTYTQQKINDHLEKMFAVDNLSLAHYRALFFVMRYPGITVSGLIDKLNITKQSLARVLSDLIRGREPLSTENGKEDMDLISSDDGFIYSVVDKNDRRARLLYLTDRGEQLMLEALNPVSNALNRAFGDKKSQGE